MAKILLSHSSKDKPFVRKLGEDLRRLGHHPWLDEWEIKVGECIVTRVEEGLADADYVILVLSQHSVKSGWVEKEWKTRFWDEIQERRVIILPVLIEECEIPPLLKTKRYADFRGEYAVALVHLMAGISPTIRPEAATPTTVSRQAPTEQVSTLLGKLHSRSAPLSQCIAEGLTLAAHQNDKSLSDFCRRELAGYVDGDPAPDWRVTEIYFSLVAELNMQYAFWGDSNDLFDFMRRDPDFHARKLAIQFPVSVIEGNPTPKGGKSLLVMNLTRGHFERNSTSPGAPLTAYARPTTWHSLLEQIRAEFTRRLVALLPGE